MFEWVTSPEAWIALGTLTALEIVLGIDNIIFISILVSRLPENQRNLGRRVGLGLAMVARLALLFSIAWVMGLTAPWFTVFGREISGRDVILILGGLFLLGKSTHEIHHSLEGVTENKHKTKAASFGSILLQITILDIVFSLDSMGSSPVVASILANTIPSGTLKALAGLPFSAFCMKSSQMGLAALDPVSPLPSGAS